MNIGIICACLPSLKTIAKHYFSGSSNDDLVFSTGEAHDHDQQSSQWPGTFQTHESRQLGSEGSFYGTTPSTNGSNDVDEFGKDTVTTTSLTVKSLLVPEKAVSAGSELPMDVP
jgi:hypothetical protein